MERLTKRFTDGTFYCEDVEDVGIVGINSPTYVGKAVNKLAEYEDAEEQGLLLRLPVAEGSVVFVIDYKYECSYDYDCQAFEHYKCEENLRCEYEHRVHYVREAVFNHMMLDKIGKTVFLTKEEAEQALKQMGE